MYEPHDPQRFDNLNIAAPGEPPMTLTEMQRAICSIDHDEAMPDAYFYKLAEEVGELAAAMRKDVRWKENDPEHPFKGSIEEEVCDVIYYATTIANIYHIDLTQCMREKEALNAAKYNRTNVMPRDERA